MDLTITIPDVKKDYIIDGICLNHTYDEFIPNPDFDQQLPVDPDTNPENIPNTQTKASYAKEAVILMMKNSVIDGHMGLHFINEKAAVDAIDLT